MQKKVWIMVVMLMTLIIVSLSMGVMAGQKTLVISGADYEIEVTVEELKNLPVIEKNVVSVNSSGDKHEYHIIGALLDDLLKKYGKSQQDLKAIRFVAGDGYAIDVDRNILKNREIILSYLINGQPIEERYQPVRAVIPGERSMYWVKNLVKIEVLSEVERVEIKRLYFLETVIPEIEQTEYTYYENVDMAIRVKDLVERLGISSNNRTIRMIAADGFEKDEERDIFNSGYIKVTGDYAPVFLSPEIPKGMYVKELLFINYGDSSICCLEKAGEVLTTTTIDGKTGIKIGDLFDQCGLASAEKYTIQAVDGYAVEVKSSDLENGIIYFDEKGRIRSYFSGLPKNTSVKYLYLIEPVK